MNGPAVTIQLMTFDEVNTRINLPMEHDIHRGIRKLKVINCFIMTLNQI